MGFGVWEGLQSIGNGCGLQMDGFSSHFDQYESNFDDFHSFGNLAVVSDGLMRGLVVIFTVSFAE